MGDSIPAFRRNATLVVQLGGQCSIMFGNNDGQQLGSFSSGSARMMSGHVGATLIAHVFCALNPFDRRDFAHARAACLDNLCRHFAPRQSRGLVNLAGKFSV
ncbi:hypothetical protein K6W36_10755 [Acetobacter senegalensis]|uniref:hypothetical protein n=1 Tax=Acetobacter senegalensis TaxID=446692 RepID=UPI001EDB0046|nr:hypothetical protein [Acetobacter senegalensis]MCG4261051.1 hypothetical protein [Acetobacter senegalensis]